MSPNGSNVMEYNRTSILCVDDDPGVLASLRRILRDDFAVLTATNVEEGAKALETNPEVELVMSDNRMPGGSGFDFLTWCRNHYPHIMRIALTGYPDSSLMMEALRSGLVVQVIAKPWDDEQIIHILKSSITSNQVRRRSW